VDILIWTSGDRHMQAMLKSCRNIYINRLLRYKHLVQFYHVPISVNGKGGKQRTSIPLKPVMEALEAHLQGRNGGYIFEGRDRGHILTRKIQRLLDEVAEKARLQGTRISKVRQRKRIMPHLLRHIFSRWSLDAGIDISYLQQQLG